MTPKRERKVKAIPIIDEPRGFFAETQDVRARNKINEIIRYMNSLPTSKKVDS